MLVWALLTSQPVSLCIIISTMIVQFASNKCSIALNLTMEKLYERMEEVIDRDRPCQ